MVDAKLAAQKLLKWITQCPSAICKGRAPAVSSFSVWFHCTGPSHPRSHPSWGNPHPVMEHSEVIKAQPFPLPPGQLLWAMLSAAFAQPVSQADFSFCPICCPRITGVDPIWTSCISTCILGISWGKPTWDTGKLRSEPGSVWMWLNLPGREWEQVLLISPWVLSAQRLVCFPCPMPRRPA